MASPTQIPIFPSSGFDGTVAIYRHLRFVESARHGDHYLILTHELGIELHFYGAGSVKPRTNDHAAYIRFESATEVDKLFTLWSGLTNTPAFARVAGKIGKLHAPVDADYGLREFAFLDHDGNLLRIGGAISKTA